ncbi:unnamed protein product, partial [Prorocentrum cordatum]
TVESASRGGARRFFGQIWGPRGSSHFGSSHFDLRYLQCGSSRGAVSSRMLGIGRGSREGVISLEASIKSCGRTKQWSVALRLLREGLRLGVQLVPGHYIATASACRKGGQWQHALSVLSDMWRWQPALALLSEMWEAKLEPNVISYNAGISACEKGGQWQRALALLSEIYTAGISACEKSGQWQRALALLSEMWEAKLEPTSSATTLGSARARRAGSGSGRLRC